MIISSSDNTFVGSKGENSDFLSQEKYHGNSLEGGTLPLITSEREARSEFLLIYTKNLSMSGRPAGRPWSRF